MNTASKRAAFVVVAFLVALWVAVFCRDMASRDSVPKAPTVAGSELPSWTRDPVPDHLQLPLGTGPMLTGVVVVAPSLELRGEITVCATSIGFAYDSIRCVTVGADGRFRIPASRLMRLPGACLVGASAPGARPSESIRTKCEGELPRPLVLARAGASIAGVVEDHFGGPVAGARVFGDVRATTGAATLTDDAGRFELWTGNGRLLVAAAGYGSVRSHGPLPDSDRRIELYPEAVIEGTVSESDGTPRRGVYVELHSPTVDGQVSISDAEGQFRFAALGPGEFELRAIDGTRGAGPVTVRVPMGETLVRDLSLEPRATIAGKLGFASGDDCTDVSRVVLTTPGVRRFESEQVGADAGEYSLAGLPVGTYRLVATCSEAAVSPSTTIEVSNAEPITHDVVFETRAASVSGYVDGITEPVEWYVSARRASSDPAAFEDAGYRSVEVSDAGEFTVTPLGEGKWILSLHRTGTHAVDLRDGPGTEVVIQHDDVTNVRLIPANQRTLELTAVHEDGDLVSDHRLSVYCPDQFMRMCTTASDGRCEVLLPAEPCEELRFSARQRISCDGEWQTGCPMRPEDGKILLVIEHVTSLEGRLTDVHDRSGVGFAQIRVMQADVERDRTVATVRTTEDGSFVVRDLPADTATLWLRVTCPARSLGPIDAPFGSTPSVACGAP